MNQKNKNNRQCYAVTPVISASLVIFIVTAAIGSFMLVGMPYINDLKRDGNFQDLEVLCGVVVDNIDDILVNRKLFLLQLIKDQFQQTKMNMIKLL